MDTEAIRKSLLSKFREVTADRVEKIGLSLVDLEKDPSASQSLSEDVARELHTMKGEARMLALPRIAEIAHACEDALKAAREGRISYGAATDLLLQAGDLVNELIEDLPKAEQPNDAVKQLCENLSQVVSSAPPAAPPAPEATPAAAPKAAAPPARAESRFKPAPPAEAKPEPKPSEPPKAEEKAEPSAKDLSRSIRVNVDALDLLGALAGDLLVEGGRASLRGSEMGALVQRINRMGDRFLTLADLVGSQLPDHAPSVARLESDLHLLRDDMFRFVRKSADGTNALRGHLERLAEQVAEARMVPLSTVFSAFPRAVRDIARQQGKEIELVVGNAEVGVDRGLLGDVRDAMVHLLRNSVDHGIEQPEDREKAGKPRKGHIAVGVRADGDMLAVEVQDDGRGMDPARLRETAVNRGVVSPTQAAALSEREVIDLIFLPNFSTRDTVSDISGRGVGMSVVKKKVEALGGSVSVQTQVGKGSRITMRLPQSMALMRVLLVRLGNDVYGIPAADVQAVGRVRAQDRIKLPGRETINFRGRATTLCDLATLLRLKGGPARASPLCVFVQHGEDRAAFAVDGFVAEREVAVKPCGGEFLKSASCVAGAASLEDGCVAVLLHVPDIMFEIRRSAGRALAVQAQERRLRVLLVDDSPIARATESALVRALGHQVDEAVDGVDGLEKVAINTYDVVVTDIQMPKMDGIEFTRRLRTDPATAKIPIVVLSSLASPEDKRRGLDAGADAYLIKGELSAESLAQSLARLIA